MQTFLIDIKRFYKEVIMVKVLSVCGSIVVPGEPDTEFLTAFIAMVKDWLKVRVISRFIH